MLFVGNLLRSLINFVVKIFNCNCMSEQTQTIPVEDPVVVPLTVAEKIAKVQAVLTKVKDANAGISSINRLKSFDATTDLSTIDPADISIILATVFTKLKTELDVIHDAQITEYKTAINDGFAEIASIND